MTAFSLIAQFGESNHTFVGSATQFQQRQSCRGGFLLSGWKGYVEVVKETNLPKFPYWRHGKGELEDVLIHSTLDSYTALIPIFLSLPHFI